MDDLIRHTIHSMSFEGDEVFRINFQFYLFGKSAHASVTCGGCGCECECGCLMRFNFVQRENFLLFKHRLSPECHCESGRPTVSADRSLSSPLLKSTGNVIFVIWIQVRSLKSKHSKWAALFSLTFRYRFVWRMMLVPYMTSAD